jgi:hypothetical protein
MSISEFWLILITAAVGLLLVGFACWMGYRRHPKRGYRTYYVSKLIGLKNVTKDGGDHKAEKGDEKADVASNKRSEKSNGKESGKSADKTKPEKVKQSGDFYIAGETDNGVTGTFFNKGMDYVGHPTWDQVEEMQKQLKSEGWVEMTAEEIRRVGGTSLGYNTVKGFG